MKKVTPEMIDSNIVSTDYTMITALMTHCRITLKSGFVLTGESACINTETFDAEKGRKIARERAYSKAWELFAFYLMQAEVN